MLVCQFVLFTLLIDYFQISNNYYKSLSNQLLASNSIGQSTSDIVKLRYIFHTKF